MPYYCQQGLCVARKTYVGYFKNFPTIFLPFFSKEFHLDTKMIFHPRKTKPHVKCTPYGLWFDEYYFNANFIIMLCVWWWQWIGGKGMSLLWQCIIPSITQIIRGHLILLINNFNKASVLNFLNFLHLRKFILRIFDLAKVCFAKFSPNKVFKILHKSQFSCFPSFPLCFLHETLKFS